MSSHKTWNGGAGFVPINLFAGTLDGKGYSITGLYINRRTVDFQGLFAYVNRGCLVENLHVDGNVTGRYYCGIMYAHGSAVGTGSFATFRNCYTTGTLTVLSTGGGFVGRLYDSRCENCYSTATVTGTLASGFTGIIENRTNSGTINCFSYSDKPFVASIIGSVGTTVLSGCKQSTAYATWTAGTYAAKTIKELDGIVYAALVSTSNQPPHADWIVVEVKTLTAAEFMVASNFVGWDFSTIWRMGLLYPVLRKFMKKQNANRSIKYLYFGA